VKDHFLVTSFHQLAPSGRKRYFSAMSITLDLPDEITADIARRAEREGQTLEVYAAEALRRHLALGELHDRQQLEDIDWALAVRRTRQ
jgi:hypothetical protein